MATRASRAQQHPDVSELDAAFEEVRNLARNSEEGEQKTDELRCQTLERMFIFGQELRTQPERMEAFLVSKGLSVNKVTRENPYNALVGLAFSKQLKKAARSQYARTLAYAHATRINMQLGDWLREGGGIADRYREAVEHFSNPYKKFRGQARHLQLDMGRKAVSELSASPKFDIEGAEDVGQYVKALIRVDEGGKRAQVVTLLDTSEADLEKVLLRFGAAVDAENSVLESKHLFPLFRAVDLVRRMTPPALPGAQLIIRNADVGGKRRTIIESASEAYSFTWARMALADVLSDLDLSSPLALSLVSAQQFAKDFRSDLEWSLVSTPEPALIAQDEQRVLFQRPVAGSSKPLRVGALIGKRTKPFVLTAEAMDGCINLQKQLNNIAANKSHQTTRRAKTRLTLENRYNGLAAVPVEAPSLSVPLLKTKASATVHAHRWIAADDLVAVCEAFRHYNIDVGGAFSDTDIADGAIIIEHAFGGDEIMVCLPMVQSARMDRTLACTEVELPVAPLAEAAPARSASKKKGAAQAQAQDQDQDQEPV